MKISLLCLILLSVYNLGISGSKFSLIVPILTYIFLTKANRISLVPIFGIVLFYSFFNVFAFRDYIVANSDGYNLFRAVEFAFEQNIGFVRILGGLHVIVDRIPGVEVIINTLGSSVSGYSDMNHVYNMVILGRYFGESSSATSLLGFLTLRFGMFYVFVALPVFVFIFLLIRRLLERFIYNEELRFLSAAAFYVMFIGMLVDGNLQLLATYVAPFYLYILSVLYCQARRVLYVR